ncbi:DUF934 domain-containing protein [bacterium]|nr:DUF934 domain-containing protein [bacterium]
MPLIKGGAPVSCSRRFFADEETPPDPNDAIVSLGRLVAAGGDVFRSVRLMPADDPLALAPHIRRLDLIEIAFPGFRDGRGFSAAQLLRRRLGYTGELRAVGQVLRDQVFFMARSGFDAFLIDDPHAEEIVAAALSEFTVAYQSAADDTRTIWERRWNARPAHTRRDDR